MEEIEAEAVQTDDIEELGKLYTEYVEEELGVTGKRRAAEGGAGAPAGKMARDEDETGGASASTDLPMGSLEMNQTRRVGIG